MAELEAWTKKHRSVKITGGPWCQPGDGWCVTLSGNLSNSIIIRHVFVGEYDILLDEDGLPTATVVDLIREALQRWKALELAALAG